jgi:hypothetical protein
MPIYRLADVLTSQKAAIGRLKLMVRRLPALMRRTKRTRLCYRQKPPFVERLP